MINTIVLAALLTIILLLVAAILCIVIALIQMNAQHSEPEAASQPDDNWDHYRVSPVTSATFGKGSLATRTVTTWNEREYDTYGKNS